MQYLISIFLSASLTIIIETPVMVLGCMGYRDKIRMREDIYVSMMNFVGDMINFFGNEAYVVLTDSMEKDEETYDEISKYKIKSIKTKSMVFVNFGIFYSVFYVLRY